VRARWRCSTWSDSFAEQLSDVLVMQRVDDAAALAPAADQSKMAQQPQLVRDGGRLHAHVLSEFVHRARAGVEPPEDARAGSAWRALAWCRRPPARRSHQAGRGSAMGLRGHDLTPGARSLAVGHPISQARRSGSRVAMAPVPIPNWQKEDVCEV